MKKVSLRGGCILLVLLVLFSLNTPRGVAQQQILENLRISFPENPSGELTTLGLSNDFKYIHIDEFVSPASIVAYKENSLLLAQYQSLSLLDIFSGKQQTIIPENIAQFGNVWNPTGIFYDIANNKLYLANYNGHNILIGSINDKGQFHIEQEIIADGMISPENVVVSNDGNMIAVADYDGNSVFVFDRDGSVLWKREVLQAHGIEIDEHAVYCTSLTSREVISFDLKGNEKKRVGQLQSSGKNGYMWPVALEVYGDQLLVVDAHASRITVLDTDLNYQTVLGSYGPYVTNLNYPYAAIVIDDDIFIADTKGKRIIQIDLEGNILAQWSDYKPLYPETCQGYIPDSSYTIPYLYEQDNQVPLSFYNPYFTEGEIITGFSSVWYLNDDKLQQIGLLDYTACDYFFGTIESQKTEFYATWSYNLSIDDYEYYLWGSPQSDAIIFYEKNLCFGGIKHFFGGIFLVDGKLVFPSERRAIFDSALDELKADTDQFVNLLSNGKSRYEAYVLSTLPEINRWRSTMDKDPLSEKMYSSWLVEQCSSNPDVKDLLEKITQGQPLKLELDSFFFEAYLSEMPEYTILENILLRTLAQEHKDESLIQIGIEAGEPEHFIDGYEMEHSLDGDPNDDYTAMTEGTTPVLRLRLLEKDIKSHRLLIIWESPQNYAKSYRVELFLGGELVQTFEIRDQNEHIQSILLEDANADEIKISVQEFEGQQRILLRLVELWGLE